MKTLALAVIAALLLQNAQPPTSVKYFAWLEGEWQLEGQPSFEVWQIQNDSLMLGGSYHAEGKDYVRNENMQITYSNGQFYFIPTVFGQNGNKPVTFKIVSYTENSFIAENLQHDFPQRISYELTAPGKLSAYISGIDNELEKQVAFKFTKAKQ
jgi:hypothetical protein